MTMGLLAFFDIDNTLIQSSSGHVEALLLSIAEVYGLEARIDVINYHGMTDQEIITRILEKYEIDRATIRSRLTDCMESMPQDMQAGREAGIVPIGVTAGLFTADQLLSAGAEKVIPDLKDADGFLQMLLKTNRFFS